jgi:hypothetical protein
MNESPEIFALLRALLASLCLTVSVPFFSFLTVPIRSEYCASFLDYFSIAYQSGNLARYMSSDPGVSWNASLSDVIINYIFYRGVLTGLERCCLGRKKL